MIHKNISDCDLDRCTKGELKVYIRSLLQEIDLIATCNQDLQDLLECKEKLHRDYVRYARQTNEIQSIETRISLGGRQ